MKVLLNRKNSLESVVSAIVCSYICDDVRQEPCHLAVMPNPIFGATKYTPSSDEDYDPQEEEEFYLGVNDSVLLNLPKNIVHRFRNIDLLVRIAKLNGKMLSYNQYDYLKKNLKRKSGHSIITDKDIVYLLKLLKNCDNIDYSFSHSKTNEFILTKDGKLRKEDVLNVLHNLEFNDWAYKTRSVNWNHLGDTLFIFTPHVDWTTSDGKYLNNVEIYIKLDVDKTSGKTIALVSMHT